MISPDELTTYIETLKTAGVTGRVKIGDIEVTIAPPALPEKEKPTLKSLKADYDRLLFAATEGIPDEEERT